MNENLKKVLEYFVSNPEYIDKIAEINEKYPERYENMAQIIALAKEAGFELAEKDFYVVEEISDEDLVGVAGGRMADQFGKTENRCFQNGTGATPNPRGSVCGKNGMELTAGDGRKLWMGPGNSTYCPTIGNM